MFTSRTEKKPYRFTGSLFPIIILILLLPGAARSQMDYEELLGNYLFIYDSTYTDDEFPGKIGR